MKTGLIMLVSVSLIANVALALRVAGTSNAYDTGSGEVGTNPDGDRDRSSIAPKSATLLALEQAAYAAADQAAREYWKTGGDFERDYGQASFDARQHIRDELLRLYGAAAKRDAAFRHLFRPLDPLYPFLSSDQQLAIERLKLARDTQLQLAANQAAPPRGPAGTVMTVSSGAALLADETYRQGLAALLDDHTLFEFLLRDSSVARQLRRSPVDFTEGEFRETFRIMQDLQQRQTEAGDVLAARNQLRGVLGDSRFAQLWASRDPLFARIDEAASRLAIPDNSIQSIYEVLSDFQDRQLQLASLAQADPGRASDQVEVLREQERRALADLIGDQYADEILRARAVETYQLFRAGLVTD